jgi:hemerythrin superfamily protein
MRLEQLCEEAIRERDQEKLQELMDQILQLLAEHQKHAQQAH